MPITEHDTVGWKKCRHGVLVKLLIPKGTIVEVDTCDYHDGYSSMRAERATVLEVIGGSIGISFNGLVYVTGETLWSKVEPGGGGIYYFKSRETAEQYAIGIDAKIAESEALIEKCKEAVAKWNAGSDIEISREQQMLAKQLGLEVRTP